MADTYNHNQEQQVKRLKRLLEGWRTALLPLKSVFLWEQKWHPCVILASTTLLFLIIWMMDLNFLTCFAVIGLIVNFLDFIVPMVCSSICNPNAWTGQKEKMFEDICKDLVATYNKFLYNINLFYSMRETSSLLYYIISICVLCTLAFIGSTVNNTLLLYLLSTGIMLWPGIQKRGFLKSTLSMFIQPRTLKSE